MRIFEFVEAVGVGDFLRHQVLVSSRLSDAFLKHLIDCLRLVLSLRLHPAEQGIQFRVHLLVLPLKALHLLVYVQALVRFIPNLHLMDLLTLGLKKSLVRGHELLQLSQPRFLLPVLLFEILGLVGRGLELALHPHDITLGLNRKLCQLLASVPRVVGKASFAVLKHFCGLNIFSLSLGPHEFLLRPGQLIGQLRQFTLRVENRVRHVDVFLICSFSRQHHHFFS